jgi:hypothetical protein
MEMGVGGIGRMQLCFQSGCRHRHFGTTICSRHGRLGAWWFSLSVSCSVYPSLCLFCCSAHIVGAFLCNSEFWDAMWVSLSLWGSRWAHIVTFFARWSLKAILPQPYGEGLWHTLQRGCWVQNHCKIHSRSHFVTVVRPAAIGGGVLVSSTSDPKHGAFNY